jgi:hypothetical protein
MRDDDDAPLIEEIPLLVEPARYCLVCEAVREAERWNRPMYDFKFLIISDGPFCGRHVMAYLPATTESPAGLPLIQWTRLLADFTGLPPSKISRRKFCEFWYDGEVGLVTKTHRQKERPADEHYPVVRRLIEVRGKRSELEASL